MAPTIPTHQLDVAYVVRPGKVNEELRHSLRSLVAHLDHRSVTLAGFSPPWANTGHLDVEQHPHAKHANALRNLSAIVNDPDLTPDVIYMNDDIFITDVTNRIPNYHGGPLLKSIEDREKNHRTGHGEYLRGMHDTFALLRGLGYPDPLTFDLHTPLVVNRDLLSSVLTDCHAIAHLAGLTQQRVNRLHWRTLYGALAGLTGPQIDDVKVFLNPVRPPYPRPFVSTNDSTFQRGQIGHYLRQMFPNPCRYEAR